MELYSCQLTAIQWYLNDHVHMDKAYTQVKLLLHVHVHLTQEVKIAPKGEAAAKTFSLNDKMIDGLQQVLRSHGSRPTCMT